MSAGDLRAWLDAEIAKAEPDAWRSDKIIGRVRALREVRERLHSQTGRNRAADLEGWLTGQITAAEKAGRVDREVMAREVLAFVTTERPERPLTDEPEDS